LFGIEFSLESIDGEHLMNSLGKSRAYRTSTKATSQYFHRGGKHKHKQRLKMHIQMTFVLLFLISSHLLLPRRGLCVMDEFLKLIAVHWENLKRLDV